MPSHQVMHTHQVETPSVIDRVYLQPIVEKGVVDNKHPSCTIQVDLSPNCEVELSVKGMLQPLEVTFDAEFFMTFMEFFDVLKSLSFQQERLLSSLNGIENANARILSKAESILSSRKKVMWDVSIINIVLSVPWGNAISEQFELVLEFGALLFKSKCDLGSLPSKFEEERCNLKNFLNSISNYNFSMSFQLQDLYDHFEVKLNDFEMKMRVPHHTQTISILEKCCPSITLASCMIMGESILKQLEVNFDFEFILQCGMSSLSFFTIVVLYLCELHIHYMPTT
ncbi:hypothetical protein SLA2020_417520 [Shorea laevis]